MPDDRLFHKRLGHSEKVAKLTDFERGVWFMSVLLADDFGVLRLSHRTLQEHVTWLEKKPRKMLERALEAVVAVGLLDKFAYEGRMYCVHPFWQDWQKVEYPRVTEHPKPPPATLARCSVVTQQFFDKHPGGWRKKSEASSEGAPTESDAAPKRSGHLRDTVGTPSGHLRRKPLAISHEPVAMSREPAAARLAFGGKVLEVPKFLDAEFVKRLNGTYFDLTAFYLALDQQLAQTGEPYDLRWIRDQFAIKAPAPSRGADGKSRLGIALDRAEAEFLR